MEIPFGVKFMATSRTLIDQIFLPNKKFGGLDNEQPHQKLLWTKYLSQIRNLVDLDITDNEQ